MWLDFSFSFFFYPVATSDTPKVWLSPSILWILDVSYYLPVPPNYRKFKSCVFEKLGDGKKGEWEVTVSGYRVSLLGC